MSKKFQFHRAAFKLQCSLSEQSNIQKMMAAPTGFEPVAYRLGGGRSIHLSYEAEFDAAVHAAEMPLPQIAECLKTVCVTRHRKKPFPTSSPNVNLGPILAAALRFGHWVGIKSALVRDLRQPRPNPAGPKSLIGQVHPANRSARTGADECFAPRGHERVLSGSKF